MFQRGVVFAAVVVGILGLPVPLLARANMYWHQPHYMPSVDEASNRLQFFSPHFAPLEGNVKATKAG